MRLQRISQDCAIADLGSVEIVFQDGDPVALVDYRGRRTLVTEALTDARGLHRIFSTDKKSMTVPQKTTISELEKEIKRMITL